MLSLLVGAIALLAAGLAAAFIYYRLPPGPSSKHFENLLVGHRGCRGFTNVPENSLPAFKFALERGCNGLELDVQLTSDGVPLVVHDDLTTRLFTTHGKYITQMTFAEARALRYSGISPPPAPSATAEPGSPLPPAAVEVIPTLREVFALVRDFNSRSGRPQVRIFVEIKSMAPERAHAFAAAVAADFVAEEAAPFACVISFSPFVLYHIRKLAPSLVCCLLYTDDEYSSAVAGGYDIVPVWARAIAPALDWVLMNSCRTWLPALIGVSMLGPAYRLVSAAEVANFAKRGYGTYVWVTNTLESAMYFISLGCSAGTDTVFPLTLPRVFRSAGSGAPLSQAAAAAVAAAAAAGAAAGSGSRVNQRYSAQRAAVYDAVGAIARFPTLGPVPLDPESDIDHDDDDDVPRRAAAAPAGQTVVLVGASGAGGVAAAAAPAAWGAGESRCCGCRDCI